MHRRVRLELNTDGRQLPFLLSAIDGAGFCAQLAEGDMLFRELLSLHPQVPLIARVDAVDLECAITITDHAKHNSRCRQVRVDYDFFSPWRKAPRMPYCMHPNIYYSGKHRKPWIPELKNNEPRKACIGFYGTHDPLFYSKNYAFPGLNRAQLLDHFLVRYKDLISFVPIHKPTKIAVSIDRRGGDSNSKSFLPQHKYLRSLRDSSFVLCLPGWCMPLSHGLIEAMYSGSIPITNAHAFMYPPLRHGIEALTFNTLSEFDAVIEEALAMPESRIANMRLNVSKYYHDFLEPVAWWRRFVSSGETTLLVNAEELSVPLISS